MLDKAKDYFTKIIHLYDDMYFSYLTLKESEKSRYIYKEKFKIGVDFSATHEDERITYYYLLDDYNPVMKVSYKKYLRAKISEHTKVNFISKLVKHDIDWESKRIQSRLKTLRMISKEAKEKEVDVFNMYENLEAISSQQRLEESIRYFSLADKDRGRALIKEQTLITISGTRGQQFDKDVEELLKASNKLGIKIRRVLYDIPEIIKYFSPFSIQAVHSSNKLVSSSILTDELASRFSDYGQGKIGKTGVVVGIDVFSKYPVIKQVKPKLTSAEIWLVGAETGGGKSNLVKSILTQLGGDRRFIFTILDVEGHEYKYWGNYMSHNSTVHTVNMSEGSGRYFDPVEIADLTGDMEIDSGSKQLAYNYTFSMFEVLLNKLNRKDEWVDMVLTELVQKSYLNWGVTDDMSTWTNSKGKSMKDIYQSLEGLLENREVHPDYRTAWEKIKLILSRYFEEGGLRASLLKDRITLTEIKKGDVVICSFGLAGKSPDAIDPVYLNISQLSAANITYVRSIGAFNDGFYNVKVFEEVQRWGDMEGSEKTIGTSITGGRKIGDVNIVITNDFSKLLEKDKFSILSNYTSFLIGAIGDKEVRTKMLTRLGMLKFESELDEISSVSRDLGDAEDVLNREHALTYAFLCGMDRAYYSIVKVKLPPEVQQSKIFETGVDTDKQKEVIDI